MTLLEEIKKNSGYEELNEGIKWFKDSKKMRRLEKAIESKIKIAQKKGDVANLEKVEDLLNRIQKITFSLETLEKKYKDAKDEKKKISLKSDYNKIKLKYTELLKIVSKQDVRNALVAAGVIVLAITILLMGFGVLNLMNNSGALDQAAENINQRLNPSTNMLGRALQGEVIRRTNPSMVMAMATLGMSVTGSVFSLSKLTELEGKYEKNAMTVKTFRVVKKLASAAKEADKSKTKKETKAMTDGDEE